MSLVRPVCLGLGFLLAFSAFGGTASAVDITVGVPELNPGSMASALTLLSAGVFLLTSGRRRKN